MHIFLIIIVLIAAIAFYILYNQKTTKQNNKQKTIDAESKARAERAQEQQRIADRKGELGEYKINFQFERLPPEYKHLPDIMIKGSRGPTQIDHVVISPYGIFVVETKNYAGWIFGNQKSKYWTQSFNNRKNRFYNPIWQNYGHIKSLEEVLKGYKNLKFHPIIAFTRRSELRGIKADVPVIFDTEISHVILRNKKEKALSPDNVDGIYNLLKEKNIDDVKEREKHIQRVKEKKGNRRKS